jgi:hypothetical protein
MSDMYQDIRPPDVALGQIYKGIIHRQPLNFSALIDITIPDINADLVFPNVRWQSRDNMSLPQVEDIVLVIFDNQNEPWVITWWPAVRNPTISTSPYSDGFPVSPVDMDIWIAEDADANGNSHMYQYDAGGSAWHQVGATLAAKEKAGMPHDSDWPSPPPDGTIVVDSTNNKLWARVNGVWKGVVIA